MSEQFKTLYLIRHGQSVGNLENKGQTDDEALSEKGEKQAEFIARRAEHLNFEVLLSSPFKRALQTAQCISNSTNKKIEIVTDLHEQRRPSEMSGLDRHSEEAQRIYSLLNKNIGNKEWHFSDEENVHDLLDRAGRVLKFIDSYPAKKILAVSHGNFLRALLAKVILGDLVTPETYFMIESSFCVSNTSVSVLEQVPHWRFGKTWQVRVWNDNAHLAE